MEKTRIYLIGSYYGFRDRIIKELPQFDFSDPRTHSQSCIAKMVVDDMTEAETCPVSVAIFPNGKRRGVMSFAELGASAVHGNHIIIDDEAEQKDPLLRKIANQNFDSLEKTISFLKTNPEFKMKKNQSIAKKYPVTMENKPIPLKNIYFCGTIDEKISRVIKIAENFSRDKNFIVKSEDTYVDFQKIMNYDLIVANFPGHLDWDRHACFMMGAAYSHDIPVLLVEDKDWKYPPLQGISRRHTHEPGCILEYITEVKDQHINREAVNMYTFFVKELERKKQK